MIFVRPDGSGVQVDSKPRRTSRQEAAKKMGPIDRWLFWFNLHERGGLTISEIAFFADRPPSTVKDGIRKARAHLIERAEIDRSNHVPALVPMFGVQPLTRKRDNSYLVRGVCEICGARRQDADRNGNPAPSVDDQGRKRGVDSDGLVCVGCGCVSPGNQVRFDRQLDQADIEESSVALNRAQIPERPEADYEAIKAALAEQDPRFDPFVMAEVADALSSS